MEKFQRFEQAPGEEDKNKSSVSKFCGVAIVCLRKARLLFKARADIKSIHQAPHEVQSLFETKPIIRTSHNAAEESESLLKSAAHKQAPHADPFCAEAFERATGWTNRDPFLTSSAAKKEAQLDGKTLPQATAEKLLKCS